MGNDLSEGQSPNFLLISAKAPEPDCSYLEPSKRIALSVTGYTMMALMILNIIFLIYNLIRYIIPLRIKSWLIIPFYALAIIVTVCRTIELLIISTSSIVGDNDCINVTNGNSMFKLVVDFTATLANNAICCIFMTTMYKLAMTIKIISDKIDVKTGKRRTLIFNVVTICSYCIMAVAIIGSLIKCGGQDPYNKAMTYILNTTYGLLSLAFGATLNTLRRAMKELVISDLKTEQDSVLIQFGLMLASFVTRFVYFGL